MDSLIEKIDECSKEIKGMMCEREGRLTGDQMEALRDLEDLCAEALNFSRKLKDFDKIKVRWIKEL